MITGWWDGEERPSAQSINMGKMPKPEITWQVFSSINRNSELVELLILFHSKMLFGPTGNMMDLCQVSQ